MVPSKDPKVGWNCIFSAARYGYFLARAIYLNYGFDINTEAVRARRTQTMYSNYRIESAFSLVTRHTSYNDSLAFQKFFQGYGRAFDLAGKTAPGMMQIIIPAAGFVRLGIPQSPISLGDAQRLVVWDMSLTFLSIDRTVIGKDVSEFKLPQHLSSYRGSAGAPFFYPAGIQLSGDQAEVDRIFDGGLTQKQIDDLYPTTPPPPPPPDLPRRGGPF